MQSGRGNLRQRAKTWRWPVFSPEHIISVRDIQKRGRLLVESLEIIFAGKVVYDNMHESIFNVYRDLWLTSKQRSNRQHRGILFENLRKPMHVWERWWNHERCIRQNLSWVFWTKDVWKYSSVKFSTTMGWTRCSESIPMRVSNLD